MFGRAPPDRRRVRRLPAWALACAEIWRGEKQAQRRPAPRVEQQAEPQQERGLQKQALVPAAEPVAARQPKYAPPTCAYNPHAWRCARARFGYSWLPSLEAEFPT